MESSKIEESPTPNGEEQQQNCDSFEMPVNYPRYTKDDYETMPEWQLDHLFTEYGLPVTGDLEQKRKSAVAHISHPTSHTRTRNKTQGLLTLYKDPAVSSETSVSGGMESMRMETSSIGNRQAQQERCGDELPDATELPKRKHGVNEDGTKLSFQMPLNYPRYTEADYEQMPEWKVDCLFAQYGLPVTGNLAEKRSFAKGAFLWPN
ncbi:uncharacterized protein A4U43_C10F8480 [Asparagus officinalis]|uniref:DUF7722 domain-containing protein n=1 Tax=Asparagus officinalis TaxID=4686 RepID=A0A5P1E383_ASPOF|nr:uncharacterized protein A4U43_C10F8480 [Asparagus officinalis]